MKSPKYCPFGFFSFFVSKTKSQEGGCHKCLKEECALWEELEDSDGTVYGQCALLSMSDSLRQIADNKQDQDQKTEKQIEEYIPKEEISTDDDFSKELEQKASSIRELFKKQASSNTSPPATSNPSPPAIQNTLEQTQPTNNMTS